MVDTVAKKNPTVKRYRYDLKEYSQLRNAIVHDRAGNQVIAEPHDIVVRELEHIVDLVSHPPHIMPLFAKNVYVVRSDASLEKALKIMGDYDMTKLPVISRGECIGLLTSNTITSWLGKLAQNDAAINLQDTEVGSILNHNRHKDHYLIKRRKTDVTEIIDLFEAYEQRGRRLDAVLISENGKADEKFLGIITLGDLPKALSEIES